MSASSVGRARRGGGMSAHSLAPSWHLQASALDVCVLPGRTSCALCHSGAAPGLKGKPSHPRLVLHQGSQETGSQWPETPRDVSSGPGPAAGAASSVLLLKHPGTKGAVCVHAHPRCLSLSGALEPEADSDTSWGRSHHGHLGGAGASNC